MNKNRSGWEKIKAKEEKEKKLQYLLTRNKKLTDLWPTSSDSRTCTVSSGNDDKKEANESSVTADQNTTEDFALKTSDSDTTNTSNGHDNESVTTKLITIEESEDVDHVRVYPSDLNADTYINTSKSGEAKSTIPFSNDIATWTLVSGQMREHFCKKGSFACQHHDNDFSASGRIFQGEIVQKACSSVIN